MKRVGIFLLLTASVHPACSCGDDPPVGMQNPDATPAFPDATIPIPEDAGMIDRPPVPTIITVSPGSGTERGGTRVTIRGTSFREPATVKLGGAEATSVVVLDEVSIAATTPPMAPGAVTVEVTTEGGTAELPNGFRYHRELVILSISPARIPEEGGVPVMIGGKGFDADTLVLFDRKPLIGARVIDAEHIEGWAPALEPGRPEIRALHREAETRRSDLLFVYSTPELRALAPGYGPIGGGATQAIAGDGFEGVERVVFGASAQATDLVIESGERITITAPALAEGVHDVTAGHADAMGTGRGVYVAYDPARGGFELAGVSPQRISTAGGEAIAVVGYGIPGDATLAIGGVAAMVTEVRRPNVILAVSPAGLLPGRNDVTVSSTLLGASVTLPGGVDVYEPIVVETVTPATGPASGGTEVTITGRAFTPGVEVRIGDVPLADVVVVSPGEITGRTVAGAHGLQDVVVRNSDSRGVLPDAFRFEEDFSLIRVDPVEGSIAGNTYVSIFGRGIDAPVAVKFGSTDGVDPVLENGSVIGVRTAPSPTGTVDVEVTTARGDMEFEDAFTFYDPRLITGGAWGGPIEGAVNVAVLDNGSGEPMPGMIVQLGYDADIRYAGVTDENGLVTISSPEIRGAQTVTAGQNGIEFVTFMELDAKNLTMFASQYPRPQQPDDPRPPCPVGVQPPIVRGRVFKFKTSLDPVTNPGWQAIARITYSQPNVFTPNQPDPPGLAPPQVAFVTADGEEYEISILRVGTVAVYATLFDFNPATQQAIPRRMGIVRQVPAAVEQVTEPIDISLDIELNQSLAVMLDNPPVQIPGPSLNAVFPFLNLQSDGVIPFTPTLVGSGTVILNNLPELAASQFFYWGGSFTVDEDGSLRSPYSLTLLESGRPFEEGLELGPFLQMPQNESPKRGEVIEGGRFSWDQGGIQPDIVRVEVLDAIFDAPCCFDDRNMNGTQEAGEPEMCSPFPLQMVFNRWSIFAQGGLESYIMPAMLSGLNAFESPNLYQWTVQEAVAPRFTWNEFIYNQFSPFFWTSWNVWSSLFVAKEETE